MPQIRQQQPLVAHVLEATSGGAKRHVLDVLAGLAARGWRLILFHSLERADSSFRCELASLADAGILPVEVEMHRTPLSPANISAAGRIASVLRRQVRPGQRLLLHGHSSIGGACGRLAAAALRAGGLACGCIYTPHAPATLMPDLNRAVRWGYRGTERILGGMTDAIIAVGRDESHHLVGWDIGRPRILLIGNGVRLPDAPDETAPRHGLLWIGRFSKQKRPLLAIELAQAMPNESITMAGDGPLWSALTNRVAPSVKLLGHVEDPAPLYARAQCLLITSSYEGLPYTIIEAMAAGCPIAGFPAPGVSDIITASGNLLLTEPTMAGCAKQLVSWLAGAGTSAGKRNQLLVKERFGMSTMLDRFERLYRIGT